MQKENQHICIAEISFSTESHILRGLLQAEEIEVVFIDGEKFESDIFTQIHVPFEQKEKAQKVVDEFFYNLKLKCPECDSVKLKEDYGAYFKYGIRNFFSALGSAEDRRVYKRCEGCGYCW